MASGDVAEAVENSYIIRPNYQHKLKPGVVKECIHQVLKAELASRQFDPEEVPVLTRSLSDSIKDRVKEMGFDRYKLVVQVVIGEQRGEGVKMAARCFWDEDTDSYAQDVFMNPVLCGCCIWLLLLLTRQQSEDSRRHQTADDLRALWKLYILTVRLVSMQLQSTV
ncbi:dynein light chain Tctex-type protein 2B isoform X2 [Lepisosteus oculatus]|uniref:dynein light chain Tctex-type protein 2B isoform X2 n=1 Tax=Lepisosteus oculatus TaxID=7918 RepID=UPI00073FBB62|nr:PREDICTED: tctex1 domain-containing protein 2 isoform X2 [Lepisosteus oculatus]